MDTTKVDVSVIMSIYNESQQYIQDAIDSICHQTFPYFEFIIIYDNPCDMVLRNRLSSYVTSDKRIILIKNKKNIGLSASLNKGIDKAEGKYLARMDADDIAMPERLEKQYNYLHNHPQIDFLGTSCVIIDSKGYKKKLLTIDSQKSKNITKNFFQEILLIHPSICAKTTIFKKYKYNENYKRSQDLELWLRALKYSSFQVLTEPLLKYRVPDDYSFHERIYKIRKSTYRGLKALQKNIIHYRNNIYFRFFYIKRLGLFGISHIPIPILIGIIKIKNYYNK